MNDEIRECLETIVWGDDVDPYSLALDVVRRYMWQGPSGIIATHSWAYAQSREYDKKCTAMTKKCDLTVPCVRVLYNHYYNIRERYRLVHMAYGPDYYER